MSRRRVCWSELPSELLTLIADRLGTQTDTRHFRSVCKQWQNSAAFATNLPINLLSPILPYKFPISESNFPKPINDITSCIVVPTLAVVVQSLIRPTATPFLCTVEELNPGKLYLRCPLSQIAMKTLPEQVPKKLNLSYFKVNEVGRFYTLRYSPSFQMFNDETTNDTKLEYKIVLIADPNCKAFPGINNYNAIVWTKDRKDCSLRLIILKTRRSHDITGPNNIKKFDDVINFKGKFFVIDRQGRAYTMDYNSIELRVVVSQKLGPGVGDDGKKRLVETRNGELYLVYRCPSYSKAFFKLYKLNEATNRWDKVKGFGDDKILIVTSDGCFFVETKDFSGLKGNSMVFCKGHFPGYKNNFGPDEVIFRRYGHDIAMFNFEDRDCKPVSSNPRYSAFFLPPPYWLSKDTSFIRREIKGKAAWFFFIKRHRHKQDLLPKVKGPIIIDIDSFPDITPKAADNVVSQKNFQGVNVSSKLFPILEKIWDKYGNVIQYHTVNSDGLLTWVLESLAKTVIILQTNSCESLNDSQAAFLRATLKDLRHLNIRLDWLAPFVYTVLAPKISQHLICESRPKPIPFVRHLGGLIPS